MASDTRYIFAIDAYTPATIPMERLAEYIGELAVLLGETKSVHFVELVEGSTGVALRVEREATPKVADRLNRVRVGQATREALDAYTKLNTLLQNDDASAVLREADQTAEIIEFPGAKSGEEPVFGPFNQAGSESIISKA